MADGDSTPVVILAFANDEDDYLKNIRRERKAVYSALRTQNDQRSINVYKEEGTSTEDLFGLFTRYADRIAIFHYGGHANGTGLRLENPDGSSEQANAAGLAQLLGMQKSLKLVFLNGCATQGQVTTLLASGVKAVIATAVPIDDLMATEFAEQFYLALGHQSTISRAFDTAKAFIQTRYESGPAVGTFRGAFAAGQKEGVSAGMTWGLYLNDDADDALEWALPDPPGGKVLVRNAPPPIVEGPELSTELIDKAIAAIGQYSPTIQELIDDGDKRELPKALSDSYPSPIGEQLRRVFACRQIGMTRLRLLVLTYEVISKMACFTSLSQLWDARLANPILVIGDEQWAALNRFMTLTRESQPTFDYLKLTIAIVEILTANAVEPFMVECGGLHQELTDEPTTLARRFMDEMRIEIANDRVPEIELASFCAQAEKHLTTLLEDFAFIVKYKFTSVKSISIDKSRNKDPKTLMKNVKLDKVSGSLPDEIGDISCFIDVNSVILQKKRNDLKIHLNISPFIIDENAMTGAESAKLFFYDYHDEFDNYHYASVVNSNDRLVVTSDKYPALKALCKEFRDQVFAK